MQTPDPDDDDDLVLSDEAATCAAEGAIDAIGLDTLAAKVTPDEILADPTADFADWGLDITDSQGVEIFRAIVDCDPGAMKELADSITKSMTDDEEFPIDIDVDCLAGVDPGDVEGFMGAAFAHSDDDGDAISRTQATEMTDWIDECADLKAAFVKALSSDPSMPSGAADCLAGRCPRTRACRPAPPTASPAS